MADCCMCGISVVTTNFVKVPSKALAWEETGKWVGLCDTCLKACNKTGDSTRSTNKGTCSLCKTRNTPLYKVKYTRPSLSGREDAEAPVCVKCLKASRFTSTNPY
jgi:hypothetical protein